MGMEYSRSFDPGAQARRSMMRMARDLREQGHIYQAIYILKQVLKDYPDTPESRIAVQEYTQLGEQLERQGMPHTAFSMYQWLEQLSWRTERR